MKVLHTPHFDRSFLIDGIEEAFKSNPLSSCVYSKATEAPKGVAPPTSPSDQPPALVNHIYHFPRSELEAIRSAATPSSSSPSEPIPIISVYDSLYAHMMQVICKASNTVSEDAVMVCQAYNGRRVMGQPHFFGSTAFWLCYPTTFTSVISSLPTTALNVHNSHSSQTKSSLLAFNGYLASFSKYSEIQLSVNVIDYDLHISSWRNCGMYNFNFGFGAPVYAGPGLASKENAFCRKFMIFLDTPRGCEGEGGVDVWLALEEKHWQEMMVQGNLHCFAK